MPADAAEKEPHFASILMKLLPTFCEQTDEVSVGLLGAAERADLDALLARVLHADSEAAFGPILPNRY